MDYLKKRLKQEVLKSGSSFIASIEHEAALFKEFEKFGWVTCYDSMFNNLYYSLTPAGKKVL